MKKSKSTIVFMVCITAFFILGSVVSFAAENTQDDKTTSKDVKRETMEAVRSVKNYSIEQRDEAVKDVNALLEELDNRIDRMQSLIETRWDEMNQASREKVRETLKSLRKKRDALSEWYGGLKYSSANAWDHVKNGFVEGYESLADAFDKAEKEFSSDK